MKCIRKLTFIVVFLGVLALMLQACNKKTAITRVPERMLERFMFLPGSYWVFRDSITGRIDSMFVVASGLYLSPPEHTQEIYGAELHQVNLSSSDPNDYLVWSVSIFGRPEYVEKNAVHVQLAGMLNNEFYRYSPFFYSPFKTSDSEALLTNYATTSAIFPSILQLQKSSYINPDRKDIFFISEYNWIVRMEWTTADSLKTTHVFNLLRYKIVR